MNFDFDLSHIIFLAVKIIIASYVLRWMWTEVRGDWFPRGFKFPQIHFNFRREPLRLHQRSVAGWSSKSLRRGLGSASS